MNCYIDSSAVLRIIFNSEKAGRDIVKFDKIGSSELLLIECARVIDRYRMENIIDDEQTAVAKESLKQMTDGMHIIEMGEHVKKRARATFPTIIGTLDALHLSTALLWREYDEKSGLVILSHDRQMTTCARALGLTIL